MNGTERIRKELATIMTEGEANACNVWKGWDRDGLAYGWWYKPFGLPAQPLGTTVDEAVEQIRDWHVQRLKNRFDNLAA